MLEQPMINDILEACERIRPYIRRTPLLRAEKMEERLGCRVYLKPEMLQITGSFKLRGALNKVLSLTSEEKARGMIASSSGNHAQALAYAARLIGAKAIAVMPSDAPKAKIDGAEMMGAEVILSRGDQEARWACVDELIAQHGYTMVHASDDPVVMAGQGTLALEVLEDLSDVDTFVVPMGGGGLISGVATVVKSRAPGIRVIGVEPASAPKYHESRKAGKPTAVPAGATIADGIRESLPGKNAYLIVERYVDEIALAEEKDIVEGIRMTARDAKLFAEGAATAGIGALLGGGFKVSSSEKVCFVLSAGNWDLEWYVSILGKIGLSG